MGDLKVGEGFIDAIMIRVTATGAAAVGLAPTCTLTRLSTGARVGLTVAEVSDGIYKVTDMAPGADDEYLTEWAVAGANTIYAPYKLFKVGGGVIADWENGGRLDLIIDTIQAKTDTIVWGDITTIDGLIDDIIADIGVFPTANYATLAAYVEDIRTRLIAILADVTGINGDAMRGTDGAALAASWTAALATILGNFTALRIGYLDELDFDLQGYLDALDTLLDGIIADIGVFPTANYATVAAYVEDIRTRLIAILADVTGLAGAAMRGTDGAALVADGWDAALATILDNFTAVRIGYLDELDFDLAAALGALATEAKQDIIDTNVDTLITRVTAAVATEAKQDIIDTNVDNLGTDVEEAHERAFLRRYPFVTTNESVANAAEVSLAAPAVVTPTFPTGATRLNSYVVAILKVNNQTAAEHNIGVTLQRNIAAGGWVDVRDFTASPPLTLPEVDATGDSVTFIEPVSVTTGQSVQFRFQVDSDNAGEVHYTQVFFFAVEYDFQ